MKINCFLFFVLLFSACTSEPKVLNKKQYTKEFYQIITQKYPEINFEIKEPLVILGTDAEGGQATHYLDNSFVEYSANPENKDQIIDSYTVSAGDLYKGKTEIDVSRIIPIVKSKDYLENLKNIETNAENAQLPELVWEPYNEDLIIIYAEDGENNINYFTQEEFEKLGIAKDTLLTFSANNLRRIVPKVELTGEGGISMLNAGNDYEGSFILLQDFWNQVNLPVQGDFVVAIPNRSILLITGTNELETVEVLRNIAKESFETRNYSISPYLYKWNGEKFERY